MNAIEYKTVFEAIEREVVAGRMSIPSGLARIALLTCELDKADRPTPSTLAIGRADREDVLAAEVVRAAVATVETYAAPELIVYWTKANRDLYLAVQAWRANDR